MGHAYVEEASMSSALPRALRFPPSSMSAKDTERLSAMTGCPALFFTVTCASPPQIRVRRGE
jgi:hypothetical protein